MTTATNAPTASTAQALTPAMFDHLLQQGAFEALLLHAQRFISETGEALIRFKHTDEHVHVLLCAAMAQAGLQANRAAEIYFVKARALAPNNIWVYYHTGNFYFNLIDYKQAYLAYKRCLDLDQNALKKPSDIILKMALTLHCLFKYKEAYSYYLIAESYGLITTSYHRRCVAQCAFYTNHFDASATIYQVLFDTVQNQQDSQVSQDSQDSQDKQDNYVENHLYYIKYDYGLLLFKQTNYALAWQHYDARHAADYLAKSHDFKLPRWDGKRYSGKETLLVHGEQGLGDEIMFAVCLPPLIAQAHWAQMRIVLAVKKPLLQLFKLNFPSCVVIEHHHTANRTAHLTQLSIQPTIQMPLASLPSVFLNSVADFKTLSKPYLNTEKNAVNRFTHLLNTYRPNWHKQLKIGIVWACAKGKGADLDSRHIALPQWHTLTKLNNVLLVSLQNAEHSAEIADAPALDVLDLGAEQSDFADTAALVSLMDVVIGVDTATTHLAGAMGKLVFQPLLQYADWRHAVEDKSVWYENVYYFRQTIADDWQHVFADIVTQITQLTLYQTMQRTTSNTMSNKKIASK